MELLVKHPKIFHLPWTETISKEDKVIKDLSAFKDSELIITEKMDGENTTLYSNYIHARSLDFRSHWSRDWIRNFHSKIKHRIPQDFRICGENVYAVHSIKYNNLESYFLVHSIWDGMVCLSWGDTKYVCDDISYSDLKLVTAPEIWKGKFDPFVIQSQFDMWSKNKECEGYVVRLTKGIEFADYQKSVAKWVRKNHVQTDEHWFFNPKTPDFVNKLKEKT